MDVDQKSFSWLNTLLIIATVLTLVLVIAAAYKGWKEYEAFGNSGEGAPGIIADITVNLGGIPYREHCLTCHPQGGVIKPSRSKGFLEHPPVPPHSISDLGCTGCHWGEGMARDLVISHGFMADGARKVLSGEDLQASCYRCHELKVLKGAEKAWDGFRLFSLNACDTCHNVEGLRGGRYGPDLSEAGSFLSLQQIQKAIVDPKADLENSIMPKFSLSPAQIKHLSYFLKSRTRESFHETPMMRRAKMDSQIQAERKGPGKSFLPGKEALRGGKCLACHKFQEEDGFIAPDLTYMAYMREEGYIRDFLDAPRKKIPGAIMPWIRISRQEEGSVVRTLQGKAGESPLRGMNPKQLYMKLCQRCHAAQGDGFGNIQPNLATFPRAFWKNGEFFRKIPDERIVRSLQYGIPGTSMPPYGELLGKEDLESLINLLFGQFIKIRRDEKRTNPQLQSKPEPLLSAGETESVFKKNCSSCHGIDGHGKGPEYLKFLPRPRDLTNFPYFHPITNDRIATAIFFGVPGTAMGSFEERLSAQAVGSLVGHVRRLSESEGKDERAN
jgi:mono/diheme cytochrome c family protein